MDRLQEIMKTAWDNGINMFDCAESYAGGQSEVEMCVAPCMCHRRPADSMRHWRAGGG